jgi:hypothetical protein
MQYDSIGVFFRVVTIELGSKRSDISLPNISETLNLKLNLIVVVGSANSFSKTFGTIPSRQPLVVPIKWVLPAPFFIDLLLFGFMLNFSLMLYSKQIIKT